MSLKILAEKYSRLTEDEDRMDSMPPGAGCQIQTEVETDLESDEPVDQHSEKVDTILRIIDQNAVRDIKIKVYKANGDIIECPIDNVSLSTDNTLNIVVNEPRP